MADATARQPQVEEALRRIAECKRTRSKELDLGGLALTEIPDEVAELGWLETLWLGADAEARERSDYSYREVFINSCNAVRAVPAHILTALPLLRRLDLAWCALTALPPEIGRLTALSELWLHGNRLTALPPEIGRLTALTGLWLDGNRLTALPPEIGRLTSVTGLWLNNNQLTELSPEIGLLTALTNLSLHGNRLTELPTEIWHLANLSQLFLGGNKLRAIPAGIGKLRALRGLYLHDNSLTTLPPQIGGLANLVHLTLSHNRLSALPPEIGGLVGLARLALDDNQLTALPPEIGRLTALTYLPLDDNPLLDPPPDVVDKGPKAILAYLRAKLGDADPPPPPESPEPPEIPPQDPESGFHYARRADGLIDIQRQGQLSDSERADIRRLQQRAIEAAQELMGLCQKSNAYSPLKRSVARYLEAVERPLDETTDDCITDLFDAGNGLNTGYKRFLKDVEKGNFPEPDFDAEEPLGRLIPLHGAMLMGTRRGRTLLARASEERATREEREAAKAAETDFAEALNKTHGVVTDAVKEQQDRLADTMGEEDHPERPVHLAKHSGRNLVSEMLRGLLLVAPPTMIIGGLAVEAAKVSVPGQLAIETGRVVINQAWADGEVWASATWEFLVAHQAVIDNLLGAGGDPVFWFTAAMLYLGKRFGRFIWRKSQP